MKLALVKNRYLKKIYRISAVLALFCHTIIFSQAWLAFDELDVELLNTQVSIKLMGSLPTQLTVAIRMSVALAILQVIYTAHSILPWKPIISIITTAVILTLTVVFYVLSWIGTDKINPDANACIEEAMPLGIFGALFNLDESLPTIMSCFFVAQAGPPTDAWKMVLGILGTIFYVVNMIVSVFSLRLK